VKSSHLIKPIELLATDRRISTVIWTQLPRSKSGLATLRTVRISMSLIQMMVDMNRSYRAASPGAVAVADATIHFLHRHDRESTWPQPPSWLAV